MKIPARPPALDLTLFGDPSDLMKALLAVRSVRDDYAPWEKFRFRKPPEGLTVQQWWLVTAFERSGQQRDLSLHDVAGRPFRFALPDVVLRLADSVSNRAGGHIGLSEPVTNPATRETYVVRSLMEESITSSQLEGAVTTRRVAKEMLRSGRPPRDHSEQMIWNNYQAMQLVGEQRGAPLTPALVRELHAIVTLETLQDPADGGRTQAPGDDRVRVESHDGEVLHMPPPASELEGRLAALCDFANDRGEEGPWLHPVVRALAVHFMVGHDHYFVDGNGRLARALFYWSMLHQGLWLTEYVTISTILRKAPSQYAHSYLNTEYESDLTYFFIYHLQVLVRAFDDLESYLTGKMRERQEVRSLLNERHRDFNHRQQAVIASAVEDPTAEYTAQSHANSHHVTVETARTDLVGLEEQGVLMPGPKRGRAFVWRPAPEVRRVLGGA